MTYQSFLIANFDDGQRTDREAWQIPANAFESLQNYYIDRGILKKRKGYTVYQRFPEFKSDSDTTSYTITAISQANPAEITTSTAHGLTTGDEITLVDIQGMTELNNKYFTITVTAPTTFTLDGIDSTSYSAYTTAGSVYLLPDTSIMGIMNYITSTGGKELLIASKERLALYDSVDGNLDPIKSFSQSTLDVGDGTTGYSGTLYQFPIIAGTLSITDGTESFTDDGAGNLTGSAGGTGSINYTTGIWSVTFNVAPVQDTIISATYDSQANIFSGDNSNFFSWENYDDKLWFCNGVDRIMSYNGITLDFPVIDPANTVGDPNSADLVTTCKHIKALRERLVLFRTFEGGGEYPQRIRWCQNSNTSVWNDTIAGQGDYLDATTGDFLQGVEVLYEDAVIFFDKDLFVLRYTGDPNSVFRLDRKDSEFECQCPYAVSGLSSFLISLGKDGIFGYDGNNLKRIDEKIIDFVQGIDADYFEKCFAYRVDDLEQLWITYVKADTQDPMTDSDNILVWNYRENVWSTYDIPLSCIGEYGLNGDKRLSDFGEDETLQDYAEDRLNSFQFQSNVPIILGGAHDGGDYGGYIFQMNTSYNDNGSNINDIALTSKFNPFNESGQNTRLGMIDFYTTNFYSSDADISFYVNERTEPYKTKTLTMVKDDNSDKIWKRIHIGTVGNTHQIKISDNSNNDSVEIHGMRLWFEPVGRGLK